MYVYIYETPLFTNHTHTHIYIYIYIYHMCTIYEQISYMKYTYDTDAYP